MLENAEQNDGDVQENVELEKSIGTETRGEKKFSLEL